MWARRLTGKSNRYSELRISLVNLKHLLATLDAFCYLSKNANPFESSSNLLNRCNYLNFACFVKVIQMKILLLIDHFFRYFGSGGLSAGRPDTMLFCPIVFRCIGYCIPASQYATASFLASFGLVTAVVFLGKRRAVYRQIAF